MNIQTQALVLQGCTGSIEALRESPPAGIVPHGVAVIAHPHPLYGGTMHNKVVQTLARAFVQAGWVAVRFNCRGVGNSSGSYDEGQGELADMLQVIEQTAPQGALALAGFSFGAFLACAAAQHITQAAATHNALRPGLPRLQQLVLAGLAASRFAAPPVAPALHSHTLVLHGEHDDVVPLAAVLDWARPQHTLPVTVIPGGGHFFHGQLPLLKQLALQHLQASSTGL